MHPLQTRGGFIHIERFDILCESKRGINPEAFFIQIAIFACVLKRQVGA